MNKIQPIFKSMIISTSILGLAFLGSTAAVLAGSTMPPGYTLSPNQVKGQYCYRHNNEASLYCYPSRLTQSMMMKHNSMMKKDDSMMKKDGAMMKKDDSMMKKDDSMMKGK
jgi:hypothetical protein